MKWIRFEDQLPPTSGAYYWVREDYKLEEPALYFNPNDGGDPYLRIIDCEHKFECFEFDEWMGPIPWADELES